MTALPHCVMCGQAERAAAAKQRQMEEDLATLLGDAGDAAPGGASGSAISTAASAGSSETRCSSVPSSPADFVSVTGSAAAVDGGGERNSRKRPREPEVRTCCRGVRRLLLL
jgi:hypothetical protein